MGASLAAGTMGLIAGDGVPSALVIGAPGEQWGAADTNGFTHVFNIDGWLDARREFAVLERNGIVDVWDYR